MQIDASMHHLFPSNFKAMQLKSTAAGAEWVCVKMSKTCKNSKVRNTAGKFIWKCIFAVDPLTELSTCLADVLNTDKRWPVRWLSLKRICLFFKIKYICISSKILKLLIISFSLRSEEGRVGGGLGKETLPNVVGLCCLNSLSSRRYTVSVGNAVDSQRSHGIMENKGKWKCIFFLFRNIEGKQSGMGWNTWCAAGGKNVYMRWELCICCKVWCVCEAGGGGVNVKVNVYYSLPVSLLRVCKKKNVMHTKKMGCRERESLFEIREEGGGLGTGWGGRPALLIPPPLCLVYLPFILKRSRNSACM